MFNTNDYNIFEKYWMFYNSQKGQQITHDDCRMLFDMVKEFAPCNIAQFIQQVRRSLALNPKVLTIQELFEQASFGGRSKDEAKGYAAKLWRIIYTNRNPAYDYCFADQRACVGFYVSFGTMQEFFHIKGKEEKENVLCNRFVNNYMSCNVNDSLEIVQNFTIQKGFQDNLIRRVVPIGKTSEVTAICDRHYGADKWALWRNDFYTTYYKQFFEKFHLMEGKDHQSHDKERVALMQQVIMELEGHNSGLMLENK